MDLGLEGKELYIKGTVDLKEFAKFAVWGHGVHVVNGGFDDAKGQ
jgi:hypothetical protein